MAKSNERTDVCTETNTKSPLLLSGTQSRIPHSAVTRMPKMDFSVDKLSIDVLLCCGCLLEILDPLTQAEFEVASQLVKGLTCEEIARRRKVSSETVKSQITSVLSKTGVRNRIELLLLVLDSNVSSFATLKATTVGLQRKYATNRTFC